MIVQAGQSEDGRGLAAATAEVIFTAHQKLDTAQEFYRDIKSRAWGFGRNPDHILSTALGLTLTPVFADVTIRYLASQGRLNAHELAAELGYFEGTGITLENVGYAQGGPASLVALAGGSVELGSAATAAVLNSIAAGNDFVAAYGRGRGKTNAAQPRKAISGPCVAAIWNECSGAVPMAEF